MKYVILFIFFLIVNSKATTCTDGIPSKENMPFCGDYVNFPIDASLNITHVDSIIEQIYLNDINTIEIKYNWTLNFNCFNLARMINCYRPDAFENCYENEIYGPCISICYNMNNNTCFGWTPNKSFDCTSNIFFDLSKHCTINENKP